MAYVRKYQKGEPIRSLDELYACEFVYFHHKITHKGWFGSWQLSFAKQMLDRGVLFRAEKINKEVAG